jgi:hypothetical protein
MNYGPDHSITNMTIPLNQLNAVNDVFWQFFAVPFLRFCKRLLGSRLLVNMVFHEDTPNNFYNRICRHLRKGIVSYRFLENARNDTSAEAQWKRGMIRKIYCGMCYYPWVRAVQMLHKTFLRREYGPLGTGPVPTGKHYFSITKQEQAELENCEPITFYHLELGPRKITPLPSTGKPPRNQVKSVGESPIVYVPPDGNKGLTPDNGVFLENESENSDDDMQPC